MSSSCKRAFACLLVHVDVKAVCACTYARVSSCVVVVKTRLDT